MKKKLVSLFAALAMLAYAPAALFATGYPVFDVSGWLAAIDQLYQAYDMVNNTITQIENQYKTIQQAVERAKSIDWDNITFDGDFDIRNDIRNATSRVNRLLTQGRTIRDALNTPSINCGSVKYSIADLCGATGADANGNRRNLFSGIADYAYYMGETMQSAVSDVVEGLDDKQKQAIWAKYGISPANYVYVTTARQEVTNAAMEVLARANDVLENMTQTTSELETANTIVQAVEDNTDSNGQPTEAGMTHGILLLCHQLTGQLATVRDSLYQVGNVSAARWIAEKNEKQAREEDAAQQAETESRRRGKISSRMIKE